MAQHKTTQAMIQRLAEFIAARPGLTRGNIRQMMALEDQAESTVYRWLEAGVSQGLLVRQGIKKSTTYHPSDALRIQQVRAMVRSEVSKRPRVGYNSEWLASYEPNAPTSQLLRPQALQRLMTRCPPGSAPLRELNAHEVSMFMCDLSYASARLEGNEYDHAGTIALLEHQIEKANCSDREKVEILNHRDAVRYIIDSVREGAQDFAVSGLVIRCLHALLSADLLRDRQMCGRLRVSNVAIQGSSYMPPFVPGQIASAFEEITSKAARIQNPYEQSFFLLVHLPYLQPFEDCNKRTARVGCNAPLLLGGVTPISWLDADERTYKDALLAIYEHNDTLLMEEIFTDCFLRSAERFSLMQRQQNPDPVAARYRKEIRDAIRARILDDEDRIPPSIPMEDAVEVVRYIDMELKAMRHNEMLGVRYGITPAAVVDWSTRLEDGAQLRERMRGG